MIRGAIEVAQKTRVAGWIYASADSVRDKLILAFVGARCVGSGKVDRFRQDLLDAKLGDGYCGFDFAIKLHDEENLGALVVKLQYSDAALIQATSRVCGVDDEDHAFALPDLGRVPPDSVSWLLDRGLVDQPEYDFLRAVHTIGVYERGLRQAKRAGSDERALFRPETVVEALLSLYMMSEVSVGKSTVPAISSLGDPKSAFRTSPCSVVALWSESRVKLSVDERGHTGPAGLRGVVLTEAPPGGIDYAFGPDRLLFLHRDSVFAPQGPAPASGIVVFSGHLGISTSYKASANSRTPAATKDPVGAKAALAH